LKENNTLFPTVKTLCMSQLTKMQSNFLKAYLRPHTHFYLNKYFRQVQSS